MKKLSLFNKFIFLLNNVAAVALLFSYCAWFINPSVWPFMGIIGLGVPVLMGLNAAFIVYWLIQGKKQLLLSTFCLILGWWHFNALFQFSANTKELSAENSISVMSYNVCLFDYNVLRHKTNIAKDIELFVDSISPDVLCIQEYLPDAKILPKLNYKHKYIPTKKRFSLAIFSRYPIIAKGTVPFTVKGGVYGIFTYVDIKKGDDTLRVVNAHLMSIGLKNEDLQTFTQIENAEEEALKNSGEKIYSRLLKAFEVRGGQVNDIADFIAQSPYRVILCGDFNDSPTSYTYKKLSSQLSDSYVLSGSGIGATHPRFDYYNIPMRIDHILASKELTPYNWRVIKEVHSDHYPVVVQYELK